MNTLVTRSPIVDRTGFSDGGAGVYCEKKAGYAVMVFAGLEHNQNITLDPGYLTFIYVMTRRILLILMCLFSIDITFDGYIDIISSANREQYNEFP